MEPYLTALAFNTGQPSKHDSNALQAKLKWPEAPQQFPHVNEENLRKKNWIVTLKLEDG